MGITVSKLKMLIQKIAEETNVFSVDQCTDHRAQLDAFKHTEAEKGEGHDDGDDAAGAVINRLQRLKEQFHLADTSLIKRA